MDLQANPVWKWLPHPTEGWLPAQFAKIEGYEKVRIPRINHWRATEIISGRKK